MQVSVEKVSNVERRLTITVPAEQVKAAYNKQIQQIANKANIKGFRPGKVPLNVVQKHYGADAEREAMGEIIQESLIAALKEKDLKPINQPRVEPKLTTPDQPFEYVASFEVLPEIESIAFSLENVEKAIVAIDTQDVERVIQQLAKQHTNWAVVDRVAQEKDRVVLDYHAIFDGKVEEENKVKNFPLELGSKVMLPGFEEGLLGTKAGDEKTLNLAFPADFPVTERAGKPVDFVITVKQVFEANTPALNGEFIKKLGVKSGEEADLRKQIQQTLEQERDRLVKEKVKEQVFQKLLELNQIEVPESLVAQEAKNIHDEIYPPNQPHHHHEHSEDELETFNGIAKKRVMLGLLISEYAKKSNLKTDKERVNQRIQEIASSYEKPREVIAWLSADQNRQGIEAQILEDQVLEKLIDGIPVKEKTMSYAELKGIRI